MTSKVLYTKKYADIDGEKSEYGTMHVQISSYIQNRDRMNEPCTVYFSVVLYIKVCKKLQKVSNYSER